MFPRDDFKDTAERIARSSSLIDQFHHLLLDVNITAIQRRVLGNRDDLFERQFQRLFGNAAQLNHVAPNLNSKAVEQLSG